MASRIKIRLILELNASGMSQNDIARTRHMSRSSISTVMKIAKEKNITYEGIKDINGDELYKMFFPEKLTTEDIYEIPDYEYVHNELKRVGVTLTLLWKEYQDKCHTNGTIPVGKTKFCDDYSKYCATNDISNHLEHRPGESCEVDWSGPTR